MKKVKHIENRRRRVLQDIVFYRDVLEIFTLSRKLNNSISRPDFSTNVGLEIKLTVASFSEQVLRLPGSIAEAEVTADASKKLKVQLATRRTLDYLHQCWAILKKQSCIAENHKTPLEEKMNAIKQSYCDWTASLPCSN